MPAVQGDRTSPWHYIQVDNDPWQNIACRRNSMVRYT